LGTTWRATSWISTTASSLSCLPTACSNIGRGALVRLSSSFHLYLPPGWTTVRGWRVESWHLLDLLSY
jgi:hypothetical protein